MLTNIGLVEYAKKALVEKWGYVWGTFGYVLTEVLFKQKLKQYPDGVGKYKSFITKNWLGGKTTDCVGLIKGYCWTLNGVLRYDTSTDKSANGMYAAAIEKGIISTMPDIPGVCLWKDGHIGVYIGEGQVIEAHGTTSGVVKTPLKGTRATKWTHWLKCPYIIYEDSEMTLDKAMTFISNKSGIDKAHWIEQAKSVEYLDECFIKIAKAFNEV